MPTSKATAAKRVRHKPVKGAAGVYESRRGDGSRVYEVRHPGKARLYETVGTRLDQAKARALEVHGAPVQIASVATRLDEAYADWKRTRQVRPASVASFDSMWRIHIEPTLGHRKVRDITARDMEAWVNGLSRKDGRDGELSAASKRLALTTLKIILGHAVEMGVLGAVPKPSRRKTPKKPESRRRILTPDEEMRLLAYSQTVAWLRPIITVALHQALRMGEVLALRWDDVDFAGGKLHVRHSLGRDGLLGPTKGGREDEIMLTPKAREVLLDLRMDSDGTGPVFRNGAGTQRQLSDIDRAYRNAVSKAALPVTRDGKVVFHSLRHTGISRLANHPAIPLVQVRDFARHTDLAVTQGYVHKIESEKVNAAIGVALAG